MTDEQKAAIGQMARALDAAEIAYRQLPIIDGAFRWRLEHHDQVLIRMPADGGFDLSWSDNRGSFVVCEHRTEIARALVDLGMCMEQQNQHRIRSRAETRARQ
jgi:hypothetical protein